MNLGQKGRGGNRLLQLKFNLDTALTGEGSFQ
jgi:hypothetical protein